MKISTSMAAALALSLAALGGCATQQQPHEHSDLMSRVQAAERAAAAAQQAAASAQARADEAMATAQANSEKVDRAFTKSQQK